MFNKVCIVGVGLIGGSLGLAIKKRKLAGCVVGVVRRRKTVAEVFRKKAADVVTLDLKEGVRGADLVILAGPVSAILSQIKRLPGLLSGDAIVVDVGSSKAMICGAAKKYLKGNDFVGCHPMAGLEKKGVGFAQADLFQGAVCFITRRYAKVEAFWRALGLRPVRIDERRHDAWVAHFSHLPHALAFALFQRSPRRHGSPKALNPSLRDLARISKSDPSLWADILFSNRQEVLSAISRFQKDLHGFEKAIRSGKSSRVVAYIAKANRVSHRLAPDTDIGRRPTGRR